MNAKNCNQRKNLLDKVHHLHTTIIFFATILLYQYDQTENVAFLFAAFLILPFSILLPFRYLTMVMWQS